MGSLTQFQRSVIIGSILGDGYLRTFPGRKNALLEINHSFKQKEYVDWKYNILANISASPPKVRNSNGKRIAYRFYSKQLPELTRFHELFYGSGKKSISEHIVIDPVILAIWYMDDGSRCSDSDYYLNTQQYNIEDQYRLINKLGNLGLKTNINKDKTYWRLRFLTLSLQKLKKIISPYIIPSMYYKLGYNPLETKAIQPKVVLF